MNMGFPDVCLTPAAPSPIPIPYPNMAMHAMAAPFCATILLSMMPALNMGSMIPMTMGDDAGVAHPFFKQMGTFTMGSPKVFLQGLPAITLTSMTTGNNMNNPVGAVLVPGAVNVLFTLRGVEAAEAIAPEAIVALAARVAPRGSFEAERLEGGVGLVRIRTFAAGLAARFFAAAFRLGPLRGLIVDLRGNPGGEANAFIDLARDLLPDGAVVVHAVDSEGDEITYRARGDRYAGLPLVLLVDRQTASAAELFAGCLKAHGRALVAGERTYGKGTAQAITSGLGGGAAHGTVARYRLPDGSAVCGVGIEPDVPT